MITKLEAFLTPTVQPNDGWRDVKPFLVVRLETDEGLVGWGECYTLAHREPAMLEMLRILGDAVLGRAAQDSKAFMRDVVERIGERRPGIDLYCAASGIEMAMWDLAGKSAGKPVYEMLGACASPLKLYANCWSNRPRTAAELERRVHQAVEAGFAAVKIYPFSMTDEVGEAAQLVARMRESLGTGVDILLDCGRALTVQSSQQFAAAIDGLDVYWLEEPVASRDLLSLVAVNNSVALPVVTGESICGVLEFRAVLELGAADMINPDVAACGGIGELLDIARKAAAAGVGVSPHNYNSMTIALAATCHTALAMPVCSYVEYFEELQGEEQGMGRCDIDISAGHALPGAEPGLGVQPDEARLRQHASLSLVL